jgi:error-prone DNA polymerase
MNQLNSIEHRRDALWQVEQAERLEGPLFRQNSEALREDSDALPLQIMDIEERLVADYAGTGLTVGKHPMHYRRVELSRNNILSAAELRTRRDGEIVRTAGCVIARQRLARPRASSSFRWKTKQELQMSLSHPTSTSATG